LVAVQIEAVEPELSIPVDPVKDEPDPLRRISFSQDKSLSIPADSAGNIAMAEDSLLRRIINGEREIVPNNTLFSAETVFKDKIVRQIDGPPLAIIVARVDRAKGSIRCFAPDVPAIVHLNIAKMKLPIPVHQVSFAPGHRFLLLKNLIVTTSFGENLFSTIFSPQAMVHC
jgi:hypothetical protein